MTASAATGKLISWVRGQFSLQAYLSHWLPHCDLQHGINWFQLLCGLLKYQHLFTCKTMRPHTYPTQAITYLVTTDVDLN